MSKHNKRIVITGLGPVTSMGIGNKELWEAILKERININKIEFKIEDELIDSFYVHEMNNFDIKNFDFNKDLMNSINIWKGGVEDIDLYYFLAAVKLAIKDSSLAYDIESNDIGLVLGHGNPGLEQFWDKIFNDTYEILGKGKRIKKSEYFKIYYDTFIKSSYDLQVYMYLFHVAKIFNLHGHSLFVNNACSSGLYAIEAGSAIIKNGRSNVVVVASAGQSRYYKYRWFKESGYPYALDGKIKPFDKNADGIVLGDGSVALVLEELEHALSRGAKIYAEYLGGSFCSESWKVTWPAVNAHYYKDVIQNALDVCGIDKNEIDLINPHGTGLKVVDKYEAKTISSVFEKTKPFVTCFKPYVGHCIGASALLETAMLLLSLKENLIPPTLNSKEFNPLFNINFVKKIQEVELKTVMKTCCAIAGFDSAVIFQKLNKTS